MGAFSTPVRLVKATRPHTDENRPVGGQTAKRPRLSSPTARAPSISSAWKPPGATVSLEVLANDEKALMDDLMAGLDASMFESLASSPSRPSPRRSSVGSPVKSQKLHVTELSPLAASRSHNKRGKPLSLCKASPVKFKSVRSAFAPTIVKVESDPPPQPIRKNSTPFLPSLTSIKSEERCSDSPPVANVKTEFIDENLFGLGDIDFADLSAFDDDLIFGPPLVVKYPIRNPAVPPPPPGYKPTPWARCVVKAVCSGIRFSDGVLPRLEDIDNDASSTSYGKTLIVKLSDVLRVVHLKERWADVPVKKDDIVNIISPALTASASGVISITFKNPDSHIILHPDLMLTMTSIANAMPCSRKPILQSLIKVPGPPSKPVLYGNLLHSLLQGSLAQSSFEMADTWKRLDGELRKEQTRMEVWGTGMGMLDVRQEVGDRAARGFEVFGKKFVGETPHADGTMHSDHGETPSLLAINGLHEVEEDIWSPKWGLKGKVDASVQAKILINPNNIEKTEEYVAPFEIKTGRAVGVMAHRAQTMLYTLLMEDRYGVPVPAGLLYYSQSDSVLRVEARPNEIRALIIARNELAHWLSKKREVPKEEPSRQPDMENTFLPATIDHPRECRNCYAVDACMLYRKTIDTVDPNLEDPIAELYEDKTGHMTENDTAFFKKWDTLLTVEEQDIGRFRSQLWTMTAKEREKTGRCFGDMIIDSYSNDIGKSLAKIHRHSYTFVRAPHAGTQVDDVSLLSGHIAKGDPVSLSIEPDLLCLSRGFVVDLTATSVTIGVTYVIDVDALLKRTGRQHRLSEGEGKVVFRIDKDEMASGMMRMRNNLAQLFFKNGDEARRRLVVDLVTPEFEPSRAPLPSEIPSHLNKDQAKAMEKVLTARDYALILGMPGTGKTTTIAEIIKALVARGKSVLLTSYTHSAVDTILMKLLNADFGVLRLGNIDKVHPDVQHLTLEAFETSSNMSQLEARLMNPPVVAATCLAVDHPLFFRRKFDYCIVDEASQITLPTCLGPLRMADTFVLVGDHFQLPPIVRHPEARRGGLDVSLFRHLSSAHPQAVTDLSHQYRMNEDIMLLSNKLVYEGKLRCGSEEVAQQGLVIPHRKGCGEIFSAEHSEECWLQELLNESAKCIFIDTDAVPALDLRVGDLVQNETEARLVQQLTVALTSCGIEQEDLAIITPYRQQIKLISSLLRNMPKVEILTADKSQGRDKDAVIISLVRSNDTGNIGDLLKDWRRINVSFTRAKKKLVIFGSAKTLSADPLLKDFLQLMESRGWIKRLSKGAEELHVPCVKPDIEREGQNEGIKEEGVIGKRQKKVIAGGRGILKGAFAKEIMSDMS